MIKDSYHFKRFMSIYKNNLIMEINLKVIRIMEMQSNTIPYAYVCLNIS